MPIEAYFHDFFAALRASDGARARGLVSNALAQGLSKEQILDDMVIASLNALGQGWEEGSVSLTQVYMGGRVVEDIINDLLPRSSQSSAPWGKIIIGTLQDHHGLGQRIVASYLAAGGAQVIPLGLGVEPAAFVQRAKEERADLIVISVLMYHSALRVGEIRQLLELEERAIPLLVGGAPFNMDSTLWKQVGASAMGRNPAEGLAAAKQLIGGEA